MFKRRNLYFLIALIAISLAAWLFLINPAQKSAEREASVKELKSLSADFKYSDKIVIGRSETNEELAKLSQQCSKLSRISTTAKRMEFSEVQKTSQVLAESCNIYVEQIAASIENQKNDKAKADLLTPAASETCTGSEDCLDPANYQAYKPYFLKDIEYVDGTLDIFKNSCPFPELQKACQINLLYFTKLSALNQAYLKALDSGDVGAAADAFDSNVFPRDEICGEIRRLTNADTTDGDCFTQGIKFFANKYENDLTKHIANL